MAKNKFNNHATQVPQTLSGALAQKMSKATPEQKKALKEAETEFELAKNYRITRGDKSIRTQVIPGLKEAGEATYTNENGEVVPLKLGSIDVPTYIAMLFADNHETKVPF